MPLSAACATPIRIAARPLAALTAAGALDPTPLRIDVGHVNNASILVTYTENAVAGGAPSMIIEGFDGLFTWHRLTLDNTGTLVVKAAGTASVVNAFVKEFPPPNAFALTTFSQEFAVILGKRFYAIRVNFFERVTPATPGTLSCVVALGTE